MVRYFADATFRSQAEPLLSELARDHPILSIGNMHVVSGFRELTTLLSHDGLRTQIGELSALPASISPRFAHRVELMLPLRDGSEHQHLRSLIRAEFSAARAHHLEGAVRRLVRMRLGVAAASGGFDLVTTLAEPLPLDIALTMLGIQLDSRDQVESWARDFKSWVFAPGGGGALEPAVDAVMDDFDAFARTLAARPASESTGLTAVLTRAWVEGQITEDDYLALLTLLIVNGIDTLTSSITVASFELLGSGLYLREPPLSNSSAGAFFDEVLRFHCPVRFTSRVASEVIEVPGARIEPGQPVVFFFAAANRDPRQFTDPDHFDPWRPRTRHCGFGFGTHRCLGRHVGSMAGSVVLQELTHMDPRPRIVGEAHELQWSDSVLYRTLEELPLAVP
jgi:cytochrome P450